MDLVGVGVEGGAGPARRFFEIGVDHQFQAAAIGDAPFQASARVAEEVTEIVHLIFKAPLPQRGAQAAGVGQQGQSCPQRSLGQPFRARVGGHAGGGEEAGCGQQRSSGSCP